MSPTIRAVACLLLSLTTAGGFAADAQKFSAGFVAAEEGAQTPPAGFWYPSTDAEIEGKLGPFRPRWAWGGAPAAGTFPVIVLSHGHTGRYSGHRHTAAYLARRGYVVVAPTHVLDATMTSSRRIVPVVGARVAELRTALTMLAAHPKLGEHADMTRIGALGYSLGTATALFAGGATPQMSAMRAHCADHAEDDPNFCGYGLPARLMGTLRQAIAYLKGKGILNPEKGGEDEEEFAPLEPPIDFRAIALVAPMGAIFSAERLASLDSAVAVFRLGDDEELKSPYHAEYLREALGEKVRRYKTFPGVHHYAFISPFPQWLLEEEDIPVAADPEGFDRAAFIAEINADIGDFFVVFL